MRNVDVLIFVCTGIARLLQVAITAAQFQARTNNAILLACWDLGGSAFVCVILSIYLQHLRIS